MVYKARVYYHHTDCGGVVYYSNYLQFLEEARTDFLARKGIKVDEWARFGRFFVVSRQEIDYRSPAYYGDILVIDTKITDVSAVRINLAHSISNDSGALLAQARTVLAFIDTAFKPRAIPSELREKMLASLH
jgi:acyl-CoA thioester hydrolase